VSAEYLIGQTVSSQYLLAVRCADGTLREIPLDGAKVVTP